MKDELIIIDDPPQPRQRPWQRRHRQWVIRRWWAKNRWRWGPLKSVPIQGTSPHPHE